MLQYKLYTLLFLVGFTPAYYFAQAHDSDIFFQKRPEGVIYPAGFLKGTACSTYQNGGHSHWESLGYKPESNWTWFENGFTARFVIDRQREGGASVLLRKSSPINRGEKVGTAADGWSRMFDDIQLIKDLGCNAHRFEMPWTDLNPEFGVWNEEAFAFFDRYIDALKENGIEPIITLYHWVHPQWFAALDAWEHEENIVHFVRYSLEVFKRFGHKVRYWATINEPTVVSVCGYVLGTHAPGKKDHASMLRPFLPETMLSPIAHNYHLAGTVLGNLFKAHVETYQALKAMPHGEQAQISIVHQVAHFDAKIKDGVGSLLNPLSKMLARQFNKNFGHAVFMKFFTTGHFKYEVPGQAPVEFFDARAPQALDFIGLNFYADMTFGPAPECYAHEEQTDMAMWAIRPHTLYRAIKEMSALQVPIIITENGICDAKDDRREKWIVGYSNAVMKAIEDGYDVQGYCYWSLLDNFEWNMGHDKKFGLYAVDTLSDNPADKERVLRKGAYAYRDYVKISE